MSDYTQEDIKEVADIILEIENRSIAERFNAQGGRVAAYAKSKIDADAVDEILDTFNWGKKNENKIN